jgi:hypothetical protein
LFDSERGDSFYVLLEHIDFLRDRGPCISVDSEPFVSLITVSEMFTSRRIQLFKMRPSSDSQRHMYRIAFVY